MSTSPPRGARGLERCPSLKYKMYENGVEDSLWYSTLPKILIYQKMLQIKVIKDSIWYNKGSGQICVSSTFHPPPPSPREELGVSKDSHLRNIKKY